MNDFKTIKISPEVHTAILSRADRLGVKVQRFSDALLLAALTMPDEAIIDQLKHWSTDRKGK